MAGATACSVVICNHNYEQFVGAAIESALAQRLASIDVVVVDDGSSDRSPEVIEQYSDHVTVVRKANGGQGSAFNVGFAASHGDVVIFLDADDLLEPFAAATAVDALADGAVKAHWPLQVVDATGVPAGALFPAVPLPSGDLRPLLADTGPGSLHFAPTSGNAFARPFLDSVLPLREAAYRHSPDKYLCWMAMASGEIVSISEPLSRYRRHRANYSVHGSTDDLVSRYVVRSEDAFPDVARRLGLDPAVVVRWRTHDWWCRLDDARRLIAAHVPEGRPFALLDDFTWAARGTVGGREVRQFAVGGPPVDAAGAVEEATGLLASGVQHLVIAEPARWWLEHYTEFATWLDVHAPVVVETAAIQLRRLSGPD